METLYVTPQDYSTRNKMLDINTLHEGDEVYWTDPEDDACSGYFTVMEVTGEDTLLLTNGAGTLVEVFIQELS